jgi:hypothetical protein
MGGIGCCHVSKKKEREKIQQSKERKEKVPNQKPIDPNVRA